MPEAFHKGAIGPIDVAVITFEGKKFDGDLAPALVELQARGIVRLIDMAVVRTDEAGSAEIAEIMDEEIAKVYRQISDPRFDLPAKADILELAQALPPQSVALVVVWENTWVGRLATAVLHSNGHVAAFERIPFEVVQEAVQTIEE